MHTGCKTNRGEVLIRKSAVIDWPRISAWCILISRRMYPAEISSRSVKRAQWKVQIGKIQSQNRSEDTKKTQRFSRQNKAANQCRRRCPFFFYCCPNFETAIYILKMGIQHLRDSGLTAFFYYPFFRETYLFLWSQAKIEGDRRNRREMKWNEIKTKQFKNSKQHKRKKAIHWELPYDSSCDTSSIIETCVFQGGTSALPLIGWLVPSCKVLSTPYILWVVDLAVTFLFCINYSISIICSSCIQWKKLWLTAPPSSPPSFVFALVCSQLTSKQYTRQKQALGTLSFSLSLSGVMEKQKYI